MTEEGKKFLFDVLRAIERIEMFSAETPILWRSLKT